MEGFKPGANVNVVGLGKDNERFVVLYSDTQEAECLSTLKRWAENPELSFTPYDAYQLSKQVREKCKKVTQLEEYPWALERELEELQRHHEVEERTLRDLQYAEPGDPHVEMREWELLQHYQSMEIEYLKEKFSESDF